MPALRFSQIAAAASLLLLAACSDNAATVAEGDTASGDILPASVSDAMIPSDTLQSQPPLMAPEPAASGSGDAESAEPVDGAVAEDAEDPAPAAEPEAAAE